MVSRSCANCNCPLELEAITLSIGGAIVCNVCCDIFCAVYNNPYFIKAEIEYQTEQQRRKQILNGD